MKRLSTVFRYLSALVFAGLSQVVLLWAMASLHHKPQKPRQRPASRARPLPILRPPRPPQQTRTLRPPPPNARPAQSLLPALKLSAHVALPNVNPTAKTSQLSVGLLHPGGRGGGSVALNKNIILTEDLVDEPPRVLSQVQPTYPPHAEINHIQGFVEMRILVDRKGRVERVIVTRARPPGVFDAVAVQAIYRWRFKPAVFQGQPTRVWARQRLLFRLGN